MKTVDKSKKSNIKCEHCEHWNRETGYCNKLKNHKNYWNRCRLFEWKKSYTK